MAYGTNSIQVRRIVGFLGHPPPPNGLMNFPRFNLEPLPLYRAHWAFHKPWWFGYISRNKKSGRFDLPLPHGTCYSATDELGAFIEKFQDLDVNLRKLIDASNMSTLSVPSPVTLCQETANGYQSHANR